MKNIYKPVFMSLTKDIQENSYNSVVKEAKNNIKSPFEDIKPKESTLPPLLNFEIPSKEELYQNSLAKIQNDELINYLNNEFKDIINNQNLHIEFAKETAKSSNRQAKIALFVAIISMLISLFAILHQFNIFSLFE